ncbi:MAG: alcohol dehydrogenase catalytic domain-containing protein [Thermoleophilia bacterium]|nr:alcohol dehydrogenase catalytic domain-containing protein [Thermoleophilia bacterium]
MRGVTKLAPGRGHVELAERPEPSAPAGHVVLDVVGAGICGTDLHIHDGEYETVTPVTMGHEVSGVVAEVGEGIDESWLGARVVSETYFSTCARCAHCRAGRRNLCPERRSIGTHVDGAFAPRLLVPLSNLHRVPETLDGHAAALCEPLACVCHSVLEPDAVRPGDEVLVTGPGPVGLLAAQVARAAGGSVHVRGTARDERRLAAARTLGFETSTTADEAVEADVVIECSGDEAGIAFAIAAARRGGRYVQMGLAGKPVTVPFDLICFHELVLTSGFASTPSSWAAALELVERRAVDLEALVSEVVPLAEWQDAFAATRSGQGIKFVLDPQ